MVKAPEDSSLALKGGDVLVSIGGRKPASPEQAMRILRSYDVGETVTIDVLRKRSHVNVTWKVPDRERSFFKMAPRMREEPSRFRMRTMPPAMRLRSVLRTSRMI